MRKKLFLLLAIGLMPAVLMAGEPIYTIDSADGGHPMMALGWLSTVNSEAKIRRVSWILNNSECPVELIKEAGLKPEYDSEKDMYTYIGKGEARAKVHAQALEVVFLSYNVFNEFVGATFGVEIVELNNGDTFDLKRLGKFPTNWAEVHYFFQTVTYVSRVRLDSGELWEESMTNVNSQLSKIGLEVPDEEAQTAIRNHSWAN